MLRDVLLKTLRDQRRSYAAWCLSVVLLVAMYVALWPSIRDQPSMQDFLDQMPQALRNLLATSGADMSTPVGYIQVEFLSFMGPILVILYAVLAGSGAVAGEEDRRTLDLLLATPVARSRIVVDKAVAMVLGALGLTTLLGVALLLEGTFVGLDLPAGKVAAAMLHLALLGLVFGALSLLVGAATGRLALSRGVPAFVAVVAYVVNGLGGLVSWLEPFQKLSPFFQYAGHDPLHAGVSWLGVTVAVATVAVLVVGGALAFERRDVAS
ncbi:ABC transporter permease [Intrasporangium chromatireducens Q5-1]|uniref:ABC transporter permease n=1 Tax=Intrasporangium chromatireducens Q5-1 TaxID=584657 RepID=W9GQG5_9MICO|nr:ABC transporter permease [Intrasporangium chromatireducens Q5-1]